MFSLSEFCYLKENFDKQDPNLPAGYWFGMAIGALVAWAILMFLLSWFAQYVWNYVLLQKIEGLRPIESLWESFLIIILLRLVFGR